MGKPYGEFMISLTSFGWRTVGCADTHRLFCEVLGQRCAGQEGGVPLLVDLSQDLLSVSINKCHITEIDSEPPRSQGRSQRLPRPAEFRHRVSGNSAFNLHRDAVRVLLDRDSQRIRLLALTPSLGHAKDQT